LAYALVTARLLPSGLALALLSRGAVPLWLALAITVALAPALALGLDASAVLLAGLPALIAALLRELCLGAAFASSAVLPWLALSYATRSLERFEVPALPALSQLYQLSAVATCLALGGHRAYVGAFATSLQEVPLGPLHLAQAGWLHAVLGAVTSALGVGLALALPLWAALWLVDATYALVLRALGTSEPLSRSALRTGLGLLIVALLLAPLTAEAPALVRAALREARAAVSGLAR
jgi:flagellar biosynthesis protein FliR